MYTLSFIDKNIKKKYEFITDKYYFLKEIMNDLLKAYNIVTIKEIIDLPISKSIIIEVYADDDVITITSNFMNNKTLLSSTNWDHIVVYSNFLKKNYLPLGRQYNNQDKYVLWCYKDKISPHRYLYHSADNPSKEYEFIIHKDENDEIDDKSVIKSILNFDFKNTGIKEFLVLFSNTIDLNTCELIIKDHDDMESCIIVYYGELTKYVEYYEKNNRIYKVYLEDGEFYQDTIIKKEKVDNPVNFVKKKGKRYE